MRSHHPSQQSTLLRLDLTILRLLEAAEPWERAIDWCGWLAYHFANDVTAYQRALVESIVDTL